MSFAPFVLRWRLAPDLSLAPAGETDVTLTFPGGKTITLTPGSVGLRDALLALVDGADEDRLLSLSGGDAAAQLFYDLARLVARGVLEASADLENAPAVRLVPRSPQFEWPLPVDLPERLTLDRFAFLRRTSRGATLQRPDAACEVTVENAPCSALIGRLASGPVDAASLGDPVDRAFAGLLVALGFVADPQMAESPAHQTWEFHDRLFQRAVRSYHDFVPRGGTYRFTGKLPAPPAIRPAYPGTSIALPEPGRGPSSNGRTLYDVMESRRSRRDMATASGPVEALDTW